MFLIKQHLSPTRNETISSILFSILIPNVLFVLSLVVLVYWSVLSWWNKKILEINKVFRVLAAMIGSYHIIPFRHGTPVCA